MRKHLLLSLILLVWFSGLHSSLFASEYSEALKAANTDYNAGHYKDALRLYRKAIQAAPEKGPAYRNAGRSYFWSENYSFAVAYYDFYLRLNPHGSDFEQIQKERALAAERAGKSIYSPTKSQREVLTSLTALLKEGSAFTKGEGGAFGMYKNLIRTGFAEPRLIDLKAQLSRRLLDEFDAILIPKVGQIVPPISQENWQIQDQRLRALKSITQDEALVDIVKRRTKIVVAIHALLDGEYAKAASGCAEALRHNPDMPFLAWLLSASLINANQPKVALEEISKLAREANNKAPILLDYVRVLRALALQKKGRSEDAAEVFVDLLKTP